MLTNNLSFVFTSDENKKGNTDLENRLKRLISTPKGTMPLDRNYGVDFSEFIDLPIEIAKNTFAVAVIEAVNEYEPEVEIENIEFLSSDNESGKINTVITISERGDEDE